MKQADVIKQKVKAYCESQGMLKDGDKVLVGVSGGADSVCLLFLLSEMEKELHLHLRVVHVCHGIRREAGEDAAYVQELCKRLGVPFAKYDVDVPALAKREGLSEEEAGRNARYQVFAAQAAKWREEDAGGTVKIALAHHAGDRAETLLFHLFRGSGLKGLKSIPPMRKTEEKGVLVVRPLLCLERSEIEEYLRENGISYCQDCTNLGDTYVRNRIRHHVLPFAEEQICKGAVRHVNQAAEMLAEAEEYLCGQTDQAFLRCVKHVGDGFQTDVASFLEEPPILQKRMITEMLCRLTSDQKDLGAVHVEAVRDLFYGESGRSVDLPYDVHGSREYSRVILRRGREGGRDAVLKEAGEIKVDLTPVSEAPLTISFGGFHFEIQSFLRKKNSIIPEKTYTKWFDYDKIKDTLFIRTRKTGDFLMIKGSDGRPVRKSLKDYFITEKVPRDQRESLPLLTEGQHVLWISGRRISEAYKVDEETKKVLCVRILGREELNEKTEDE